MYQLFVQTKLPKEPNSRRKYYGIFETTGEIINHIATLNLSSSTWTTITIRKPIKYTKTERKV